MMSLMKRILKGLANIGIDHNLPLNERRYIILVNVFTLFLTLLAWFYIPLVYFNIPGHPELIITLIMHGIMFIPVLLLNHYKKYLAARLFFGIIATFFISLESLLTGKDTFTHFFLITASIVPFFIYPSKERIYQYSVVLLIVSCFIFLNFWYMNHEPIINISDPGVIGFAQWSVKIGSTFSMLCIAVYAQSIILKTEDLLEAEHKKSESLLRNILPDKIADRLKSNSGTIADGFEHVSILFADIVGFTEMSSRSAPEKIVNFLNSIFSVFDDLADKYRLEKIKTIGDAYMAASGIPEPRDNHAEAVLLLAIDMIDEIDKYNIANGTNLKIRIGINTGSAIAGVIGKKKFTYDLWGDSVNTASRMESHGIAGRIQVTDNTYHLLKNKYTFEYRGEIEIKGKGKMKTYIYNG